MDYTELDSGTCSVARTASLIGDAWTVLVLRDLFNGVRRFDDLAGHLGIARNVLTRRLATLVDAGLVERVPYREPGRRERHEYHLTPAGRDLRPIMLAMLDWGDTHLGGEDGPPMRMVHPECGAPVHVEVRCENGHVLEPEARVRAVPGPGARRRAG
ncbi:winged helix-turn-helix transcriptional regulator [Pseudonocardia bannensis]|uniref:Helix-turn-helix transcriptional regulator n=1 Tax=Pseudonocardia bannensis TaxID=630973 RepID=A0A848DL82_9PSEU|nr:helix-turn-helix domain-containing protein [Pseudonocardia bannensis]NMH93472.1 helix-turn-helix transcriptional regulator [Pseudonocardia bannensis]